MSDVESRSYCKLSIIFLVLILSGFSTSSDDLKFNLIASENMDLADILKYFPAGVYSILFHVEYDSINRASGSDAFYRVFGTSAHPKRTINYFLPKELQKDLISYTWGEKMDIKITLFNKSLKVMHGDPTFPQQPGVTYANMYGGKDYKYKIAIASNSARMWIVRYFDLESKIATCLKKGTISENDTSINGRKVYITKKSASMKNQYYLLPTVDQELLASQSLEVIEKMVAAQDGSEISLIEDDTYKLLSNYSQDLGHFWGVKGNLQRAALRRYEEEKDEMKSEIIEACEIIKSHKIDEDIFTVFSVEVTDEVREMQLRQFDSSEIARKNYEEMKTANVIKSNIAKEFYAFDNSKRKAAKVTLDGNNIITNVLFDKKLVKKSIDSQKAYREFMAEYMAKKNADKDDVGKKIK